MLNGLRGAVTASLLLVLGCGAPPKDQAVRLNPAECSPLHSSALVGYALREGAPMLDRRWRYRCVAFEAPAGRPTEITVFADGFHPELYLVDPASRSPLVAWSRTGPGQGTARIAATLERPGTYIAVITTIEAEESGSFLVSIQ